MEHEPSPSTKAAGHEPIEADTRAIWLTGVALAAVAAASLLIVAGLMKLLAATQKVTIGPAAVQVPMAPGVPKLNPEQPVERRQLFAGERELLDSYGWIDRPAGIARIPIGRAMQIIAAEGLPKTPPSTATEQAPPRSGPTQESTPTSGSKQP
jgi:hypothetical protein